MSDDVTFNRELPENAGLCEQVSPLIRRIVAPNPSPYTFTGTCSYIIGKGEVAILDPGPLLPEHCDSLLQAVSGETVSHIVVTHTHRDHSPAARIIRDETGAQIVGCHPHPLSRPVAEGEIDPLTTSCDGSYKPDIVLEDGWTVEGKGWLLETVATPGHTANHLSFRLNEENALFSGDHVMAWSTTVVAPPEGSMSTYMASLEKLLKRDEVIYWPGHGGPVNDPKAYVRALLLHRRAREAAILRRIKEGDSDIPAIVSALYPGLNPALIGAASCSVFAHLEDMVQRGLVTTDSLPSIEGLYAAS
ncbi:MBL fold metallo-hydrolase [Microvirga sp. W0021]|uniref:MBL fold metallo-hydrolase n=1 Tax=Hohaiivirga grylli TaxID=3133970 RepID=A0ABV0BID3_9HYPH